MPSPKRLILVSQKANEKQVKTGVVPEKRQIPKQQAKTKINKWSFGFQFFSQIKYFQIGGVDNSWFISLITRLREVSQIDRDRFLKDFSQHGSIRYHEINWNGTNVPISRADLNWIDKDYLDNEDEFPMLQFHISKALGRIVGFWDEFNIFQVVLLDPLHNIQPAKRNDYHVDDTYPMSCEYSSLLIDINKIQKKIKATNSCNVCSDVSKLPTKLNNTNFLYCCLDDDFLQKLNDSNSDFQDILELGLLASK